MKKTLQYLYPDAPDLIHRLESMLQGIDLSPPKDYQKGQHALERFTEEDSMLIVYGDQFSGSQPPLRYLFRFLDDVVGGLISGVHILPFFPYSSDDGFSISDYRAVNPALGTWSDIEQISGSCRLMADLVLNHCSVQHPWFQAFLRDEAPYNEYFIALEDPHIDLSQVFRPRSSSLLSPFETARGRRYLWTTFSADQVDLNFHNPEVLLEMLQVMLDYVQHGVQILRLDAVAYVWKELGSSCIHHPKTHAIVRLLRLVLQEVAPWVVLISETNVPYKDNISYFGKADEAHMVYRFSLPPLVLDAILRADASHLQNWAAALPLVEREYGFFNFTASHDGIGLLPANDFLSDEQRAQLIENIQKRGGHISMKATAKGDVPYEANINYLSAVTDPNLPYEQRAAVFLLSQAILLSMAGIPGIYLHSLIGSENWTEGVSITGQWRSINRQKLPYHQVVEELSMYRRVVFEGYTQLLRARTKSSAFSPFSPQTMLAAAPSDVFAFIRGPWKGRWVLCLYNLGPFDHEVPLDFPLFTEAPVKLLHNLINGEKIVPYQADRVYIEPQESLWLEPTEDT